MAESAAHVTMLQRSPTYIVSAPNRIASIDFVRRWLPPRLAYRLIRWRNVLFSMLFFQLCRRYPLAIRRFILKAIRHALGEQYDLATHFTPRYNPWDQRLCLVPDGDLFKSIRAGKASVCTGEIDSFTENGIKLRGAQELQADIIVTATGLNVVVLGSVQIIVDAHSVDLATTMTYKGCLFSNIPNLAASFGYTNASWTLKCELTCNYVGRLLNHMDRIGQPICVPQLDDASVHAERWLNLTSGYIERAVDKLPRQGSRPPWKLYQNYPLDLIMLNFGAIDDGVLHFSERVSAHWGRAA
jgi:cation diffusion facilitator CzcD-associated flavoprotein CzcO